MNIPKTWSKRGLALLYRGSFFKMEAQPMSWWATLSNKLIGWPKRQYKAVVRDEKKRNTKDV